jgi:hypothetical protein
MGGVTQVFWQSASMLHTGMQFVPVQVPPLHTGEVEVHALPQVPQLLGSVPVLVQVPPQLA